MLDSVEMKKIRWSENNLKQLKWSDNDGKDPNGPDARKQSDFIRTDKIRRSYIHLGVSVGSLIEETTDDLFSFFISIEWVIKHLILKMIVWLLKRRSVLFKILWKLIIKF